jgi:hypothetical protein
MKDLPIIISLLAFTTAFGAQAQELPADMDADLNLKASQCSMQLLGNDIVEQMKTDVTFMNKVKLLAPPRGDMGARITLATIGVASLAMGPFLFSNARAGKGLMSVKDPKAIQALGGLGLAITSAGTLSIVNAASGFNETSDPKDEKWTFDQDKLGQFGTDISTNMGRILYLDRPQRALLKTLIQQAVLDHVRNKDSTPIDIYNLLLSAKFGKTGDLLNDRQKHALLTLQNAKKEQGSTDVTAFSTNDKIQFLATCQAALQVYLEGLKDVKQKAELNGFSREFSSTLKEIHEQQVMDSSFHSNADEEAGVSNSITPLLQQTDDDREEKARAQQAK